MHNRQDSIRCDMVEVSDFGFVLNYALYNELPTSITGYIDAGCGDYMPPPGYAIASCEPAGMIMIGGSTQYNLSKIHLIKADVANSQTMVIVGGVVLIAVVGIALFIMSKHGSRKRTYSMV
jgi:hypothetical protein